MQHLSVPFPFLFQTCLRKVSEVLVYFTDVDLSSGIFCGFCKRITHIVKALISDKDNERRVIALTKMMCKKLPSPFSFMVGYYYRLNLVLPNLAKTKFC